MAVKLAGKLFTMLVSETVNAFDPLLITLNRFVPVRAEEISTIDVGVAVPIPT